MNKKDIFKIIIDHCCEVLPELSNHSFQRTDQMKDLGANSIDRMEVVTLTLQSLSLQIPRIELAKVRNMGELVDTLYEKLKEKIV
jgi:polyketide biosynthesis acyl carrier protein